jgi:hypothetical protein
MELELHLKEEIPYLSLVDLFKMMAHVGAKHDGDDDLSRLSPLLLGITHIDTPLFE